MASTPLRKSRNVRLTPPSRTLAGGVTTTFDAADRPTSSGFATDLDGRLTAIPVPVMSMRLRRVGPVILLATALAFAGCCGDGRGFGVWVESSVSEPVIIVLTPGVDAPELEPRLAYLVRDTALRQSAWVLVGSDEDATGTIEVYSLACELRGSVDVRSGEYRVSIAADGTFTVARFGGLFGKGPQDAPDLERSPVDCAPPSPAPTSEPLIP